VPRSYIGIDKEDYVQRGRELKRERERARRARYRHGNTYNSELGRATGNITNGDNFKERRGAR